MNDLFNNNEDHQFYYETDNYQYQYINNCIFPSEEIGDILMLKEDIFNKYKEMLDKFYKEKMEKENENKINEEKDENKKLNDKDINDDIMNDLKKESKKGKKRRKKNK